MTEHHYRNKLSYLAGNPVTAHTAFSGSEKVNKQKIIPLLQFQEHTKLHERNISFKCVFKCQIPLSFVVICLQTPKSF